MNDIMQGDQYGIPFQVETENGIAAPELFADVEIVVGAIRKTLSRGEVTYNKELQAFMFPITQEESLGICSTCCSAQARFKFKNGEVVGVQICELDVLKSKSREVL